VLEARGELDPDGPVAQQFVLDYVKDAIMHEVGHALGLRHNFRASRAYTEAQLADPEFTRANGTSGSVMEYNAVNLPRPGERGGMPFQTTLGPTTTGPSSTPTSRCRRVPPGRRARAELQRIAARSAEPLLAFGTDEDSFLRHRPRDPAVDLGDDPLAFAAKRLAIARDLFQRQETRELPPDRDYAVLRRSLGFAIIDVTRAMGVLARQIGGVRTLRDFPGSGRDPLQPVPAAVQREALDLIAKTTLSPKAVAVARRCSAAWRPTSSTAPRSAPTDFSVQQRLLDLQRAVLAYLLSRPLAARVQATSRRAGASAETRAHLQDVLESLQQALQAKVTRGAV
jgi:hypothetical protein